MLVRCLSSSFAARRFVFSSPVALYSISSTETAKPINTEVSSQDTTVSSNSSKFVHENSLGQRLLGLSESNVGSVTTVLADWKEEKGVLPKSEFLYAIRKHIRGRRYEVALALHDSMLEIKDIDLNPKDYSYHLDLIRKLRGAESAKKIFDDIPEAMKDKITLLAEAAKLAKSTNKELSSKNTTVSGKQAKRFDENSLGGRLLRLSANSGSVATIIAEYKDEQGVLSKDEFLDAIRLLVIKHRFADALKLHDYMLEEKIFELNPKDYSYHLDLVHDLRGIESAVKFYDDIPETMKDELTSSALLHIFVSKGEAAKAEAIVEKRKWGRETATLEEGNCILIGMYGNMGNKDDVLRIWDKIKSKAKKVSDIEYEAMVRTLLKLNVFDKAEEIFKEWEAILTNPVFCSTSNFLRKYRRAGKMSSGAVPDNAEEDKFQSDLGSEEDEVDSEMGC